MHWVAVQFAAGRTLFPGLVIAVLACALGYRRGPHWLGPGLAVGAITGGLLVLLSAAPFPLWVYGLWFLAGALAVVASERPLLARGRLHRGALVTLAVVSLAMTALELPYLRVRPLPFPRDVPVFVIGDSLAMSLETGVAPWPAQWGALAGLQVTGLAAGGKRAEGALSDLGRIGTAQASVLVEIGGNDMLGGTPTREFERALGALLEGVCVPGRAVAMFELPLTPFYNSYGRIQRRYARQHHIVLIPKRCLADLLATPEATVDGIHLSGVGHAMMGAFLADLVH